MACRLLDVFVGGEEVGGSLPWVFHDIQVGRSGEEASPWRCRRDRVTVSARRGDHWRTGGRGEHAPRVVAGGQPAGRRPIRRYLGGAWRDHVVRNAKGSPASVAKRHVRTIGLASHREGGVAGGGSGVESDEEDSSGGHHRCVVHTKCRGSLTMT